jgi:hypothetical protein
MKLCQGLFLSLLMCVAHAAQEPEKGVDRRTRQEYCVVLEAFEKLIEALGTKHAQEQENLKAETRKEFSDYMKSQSREFTDEKAMRVLASFEKEGAKKAESLRAKQTQEKQEEIRDFVGTHYPDMERENLEDFCIV